jgi:CBS domain-containing protein
VRIDEAMTAPAETVRPDMSLKDVADIFAERGIGGLPVVDEDGRLLGVITEADILIKERVEEPTRLRDRLFRREARAQRTKYEARTVGEAMSSPAITVQNWLSVSSAAEVMVEHGVNRLPVVQGGTLVGIITRHDLVCAFARSDSEIEREIRTEAFAGLSSPESLQLTVDGGEVVVRGMVDSRFDAETLPDQIRRVPGVVAVDARLGAYDVDSDEPVVVSVHRE